MTWSRPKPGLERLQAGLRILRVKLGNESQFQSALDSKIESRGIGEALLTDANDLQFQSAPGLGTERKRRNFILQWSSVRKTSDRTEFFSA